MSKAAVQVHGNVHISDWTIDYVVKNIKDAINEAASAELQAAIVESYFCCDAPQDGRPTMIYLQLRLGKALGEEDFVKGAKETEYLTLEVSLQDLFLKDLFDCTDDLSRLAKMADELRVVAQRLDELIVPKP